MRTHLLVLLAAASTAFAQQSLPPVPTIPTATTGTIGTPRAIPGLPAPGVLPAPPAPGVLPAPPAPLPRPSPAPPKINYRIRLEIKEAKESPIEMSVITCDGRIKCQMINPKRLVVEDREIPSTVEFTGALTVLDSDKCQLVLFLGRTIPYVTSVPKSPLPKSTPPQYAQIQQMQVGLDTTVVLQVGKPLIVQSDPLQQVKITLEKVE